MGDKSFLFSSSGNSFLMYAKRGRSWVALFDPVGRCEEWPELVWRFVELADKHGGRAAFYQVRPDSLPLYLDAGLRVVKVGEEACIYLEQFCLEGSERYGLRQALKRGEREGLTFQILPPQQICQEHEVLSEISDRWLARITPPSDVSRSRASSRDSWQRNQQRCYRNMVSRSRSSLS